MAQGYSNSAACREVGVMRRTGSRWRYGRVMVNRAGERAFTPPIGSLTVRTVSARYLSEDERITIADGVHAGRTLRAIAAELGRAPSTVSREVRRNRDGERTVPGRRRPPRPDGSARPRDRPKVVGGGYHPHRAEQRALGRRARPKPGKLATYPQLQNWVQARLEQRWSPEQIARTLPLTFPDRPEMRVAPETVYQALYVQGRGELRRELTRALRTGRALPPAAAAGRSAPVSLRHADGDDQRAAG